MATGFQFPDEAESGSFGKGNEEEERFVPDKNAVKIGLDKEDEVEVEIVDDVPEKDRGRKPLDTPVGDPTDEELEQYGEKVRDRIKSLTHARHDERRAKEQLARERDEAFRAAQNLLAENNALKQRVNVSSQNMAQNGKAGADAALAVAKQKFKEAQETFDSDKIADAQVELMRAVQLSEQWKNFRPQPLQETQIPVQQRSTAPQPVAPDEKSLRCQARNQWFGAQGFEEVTSYSLGLHQKLVNKGVDPTSDDYFKAIDDNLRSKFPEVFRGQQSTENKRPSTVVASASRSSAGGVTKIRLTQTQIALAKRMGLTPKQYAVEVAKLEARNG